MLLEFTQSNASAWLRLDIFPSNIPLSAGRMIGRSWQSGPPGAFLGMNSQV